jgi:hypothetical protein
MTNAEASQLRGSLSFEGNVYDLKPRKCLSALDEAEHRRLL